MKTVGAVLSWLFSIIFCLLALSMFLMGNLLQAIVLLGLVLLLLPPVSRFAHSRTGRTLSPWVRAVSVVALLAVFYWLSTTSTPESVYTRPEYQARHMAIYDAKLEQWPVPHECLFVDTSYGTVHVIASGPQDAPPALLLHASGVSSWSWLTNVEALNKHYRTYAIDTIGDAGKSTLSDVNEYPANGKEYADLYVEIAEALDVEQAFLVGASFGGYIATNYALYYPERVEKLALLGPMGMTPATGKTVMRIMLVQFFPLQPLQESTVRWALGDDPKVLAEYGEWFRLVMSGTFPKLSQPVTFTPEQLQNVQVPVLLILGEKDSLTDDPEKVKELAQYVPDIQVEVLDSGHLIGVEQPQQVNEMIGEFFGQP